ncbi:MAG: membrane protein insertase YidC [Flavipsychrobacter sp.]|nr:membrane protein insertase YidC [Flavipsychrobacter sp.]
MIDRNSVIGFLLLVLLVIGYVFYNNHEQDKYLEQKKATEAAAAKAKPAPAAAPAVVPVADSAKDTMQDNRPAAYRGTAQTVKLENKKLALEFSTKGAQPLSANILGYKTSSQQPLYLYNGKENELSAILPINNGAVSTKDLYFTPATRTDADGSQVLEFTADLGDGKTVLIAYKLPADDYMLDGSIRLNGMTANSLPVTWQMQAKHTEHDITAERNNSQVYYRFKNEDHDYFTIREDRTEPLNETTHWIGYRMQYFSTAFIADEGLSRGSIKVTNNLDTNHVSRQVSTFDMPLKSGVASFNWYIGPNHYKTLRQYKIDLDDMVPLGYGIMAFVKYINKWLIIPIFNVLSSFISNFGLIIILMTIFIRLILSFFTYKSYLSAAKMRVLKPEIDELRAQYKDDQQKFGMEQMKLYKSAGVNPLGGCLPTLFQMPILFAMYYFFPSSIELRQESFLWANDLSTYDSIASLPFSIPGYGSHVSLFTILMTASSLFLALYNRNMTSQDPNNPMMKWMPYIFPFILIGVFNQMAAALTFYYFFSNMISILQQFIIQKYIIDEKKIHAQLQENKNKPAAPSKWAQRIEEMQKAQAERGKKK